MQTHYLALWSKIKIFNLDDPSVQFPFSKKLAAENNWSDAFTKRAITEYKKFIFLSCISENGASPSEIVDSVWHLHLTYTKSYWNDFCKKTLGKDIHHYPSKGGFEENTKHKNWYVDTVILYQQTFNEQPPIDIWPLPTIGNNKIPDSLNLNANINIAISAVCFILVLFSFIISAIQFNEINPFQLRGPQFL